VTASIARPRPPAPLAPEHRHIFDIIEDKDLVAIAMEFIEGRSLAVIIAERAPLLSTSRWRFSIRCAPPGLRGGQGIVHRDIKPANILVTAAAGQGDRLRRRPPRAVDNDPGWHRARLASYMSPEQVRGLSLDGRSDLFAAAVVFFEMITRERPFAGDDIATTMYRIANEPPTPQPSSTRRWAGIAASRTRLREEAADRFQTGAEFAAALRAAASLGRLAASLKPSQPWRRRLMRYRRLGYRLAVQAAAPQSLQRQHGRRLPPAGVAAAPAATGSGGNILARLRCRCRGPAAPSIQPASGPELPAIPLPPESGARAIRRPSQHRPPAARGRRRLALAGAAESLSSRLACGRVYLRGGPMRPTRSQRPPAPTLRRRSPPIR